MSAREPNKRPRRDKYISRACRACQRRKSKCSGHDPCLGCQGRDLICTYSTEKRRPRRLKSNIQRRSPTRRAIEAEKERDLHTPEPSEILPSTNQDTVSEVQDVESSSSQLLHADHPLRAPRVRASLFRSIGNDPNRSSLRSQILDARSLFKDNGDHIYDWQEVHGEETHPIELPVWSDIEESLHLYFDNTAKLYPAIHPANTTSRLHETLKYLRYSSSNCKVEIDCVAAPTVTLLCIIIAIAKTTGEHILHSNHPSLTFRNHARNILQTFESLPASLEILRCHTLMTLFLLRVNLLDLALQSIAVTVRLAMVLRLHRRSPPGDGSDSYDENLWWTIYILDRDIACLGGTAYLIRDEEIDSPRRAQEDSLEKFSSATYINRICEVEHQGGSEKQTLNDDAKYLEVLAHLGRLWGRIWCDLVSNIAESDCQWQSAEVLDAQIRILQQRLPPELTWSPSSPGRSAEDEEVITQRQLIVLMRINTLRLLIRQNPFSTCTCLDQKAPHSDGTAISVQTIEAITSLSARRETLLPIGQNISITLVQCILYLVNVIGTSDNTGAETASSSVVSAYQILINLSEFCISAKKAVETLDAAFFRDDAGLSQAQIQEFVTPTRPQRRDNRQIAGTVNRTREPQLVEKQHDALNLTKHIPRPNDLFGCLQQRYESLDCLLPVAGHKS